MKRVISVFLLLSMFTCVTICHAQKSPKPPSQKQLAEIAELEHELELIRREIVALEGKFRNSYLNEKEESMLQATYQNEESSSRFYLNLLGSMLDAEKKAFKQANEDELARMLSQDGGIVKIQQEVDEVTSRIQQGLADFSEYYKLFQRQTPEERRFTYKLMQHELRIHELEEKIKKEQQRKMISDLKNKIYQKTGYRPSFNGKKLSQLPTDEGTYDFIEEIDADRRKFNGVTLTPKEKQELINIRDKASQEYTAVETNRQENKKMYDLLSKGYEALKKRCPECANQQP